MKKKKNLKWLDFVPYSLFAWLGNRISWAFRQAEKGDISAKINGFLENFLTAITVKILPSFNGIDFLFGLAVGFCVWLYVFERKRTAKKFRINREHGSAEWGTEKDILPFMDVKNPDNNVILTQTEQLTMTNGRGALDRNKNVLVEGSAGTAKTLFVVKPNLMQLHSSYVITDPKGSVLKDVGRMFQRHGYKIKIFNTVEFDESMHYNPFAYFRKDQLQEDIRKFINVFMANTGEKPAGGDDFWNKAEVLIYTAYIGLIFTISPENERNISTLVTMITQSSADEGKRSPMDLTFEAVDLWLQGKNYSHIKQISFPFAPTAEQLEIGQYAVNYYKRFKQAAGKTLKSILISCSSRLSAFDTEKLNEITSKDTIEMDKVGDEKTAFFIITSDTNSTYDFIVAIMYSQLFDLLCDKAYEMPGNRLKYHVRFILDEFANSGKLPDFEKKISVLRSREMSVTIIIQAMSQLEAIYKEQSKTIVANCDSYLLLGTSELSSLEWVSKMLGKETIDTRSHSTSHGEKNESYSHSDQKSGRELMSPDEIRVMDGTKCILIIRGIKPFFSQKFDISTHKRYGEIAHNEKSQFNIKNYIEKIQNRKCVIQDDDVFEIWE
jgi:type IV secretion system protein VirD4